MLLVENDTPMPPVAAVFVHVIVSPPRGLQKLGNHFFGILDRDKT